MASFSGGIVFRDAIEAPLWKPFVQAGCHTVRFGVFTDSIKEA